MSICVLAGTKSAVLAVSVFTLTWQHSVEHTAWSERWQVGRDRLTLTEARVKGSGAGMDPGPGARLRDGWWIWTPTLPPVPRITLAASGATGGGWRLCPSDGACLTLGAEAGDPVVLEPCG